MNTAPLTSPDVERFVDAVRRHFTDLDPEEREELLGGLEADIADLVAERGPGALGDPDAYAAELRAAAGLAPTGSRRPRSSLGASLVPVSALLDEGAARWSRVLASLPAGLGEAVRSLRPAWWVFRAWLAVMLVSVHVWMPREQDVPYLPTRSAAGGLIIFAIAALVSVQVGRGVLWPGTRSTPARLVLLGLNLFALAVLPNTVQNVQYTAQAQYADDVGPGYDPGDVTLDGDQVCNLQAYDADGRPLSGVQLFTGQGRPLDVRCPDRYGTGAYPWLLGDVARWNVFPQAERRQRGDDRVVPGAYDSSRPPAFPEPARPSVPAVTHPLQSSSSAGEGAGRRAGALRDGVRRDAGTGR